MPPRPQGQEVGRAAAGLSFLGFTVDPSLGNPINATDQCGYNPRFGFRFTFQAASRLDGAESRPAAAWPASAPRCGLAAYTVGVLHDARPTSVRGRFWDRPDPRLGLEGICLGQRCRDAGHRPLHHHPDSDCIYGWAPRDAGVALGRSPSHLRRLGVGRTGSRHAGSRRLLRLLEGSLRPEQDGPLDVFPVRLDDLLHRSALGGDRGRRVCPVRAVSGA